MKLPQVDHLLESNFRFLVDEAGFAVLDVNQHRAELANVDIRISLFNDMKDGAFAVLIARDGELHRFYPLTDYADFFEGKRTRLVRDIPSAREQAAQLKEYLPRILDMLCAPDSDRWKAYDEFFRQGRATHSARFKQ